MTAPYYNGMYHPGVIQTPGAGEAIASGLGQVLGAILQKRLLDQQAQTFQGQQESRAADIDETRARTGLYGAQTQKALRPEAPDQKPGHVMVQPDGSVVLIDPMSGKVTPVPGAKGIPTIHNLDPNSPAGLTARIKEYQATTGAAERQRAAREEMQQRQERIAQGQAILGSAAKGGPNDPVLDAFGQAFRSVRAGNRKMHPGEIAFYAWQQLQKLRPDLIPAKPRVPGALDDILSASGAAPGVGAAAPSGAPAQVVPTSAQRPTAPATAPAPLTADEIQAARTDPNFANWLKTKKGYSEKAWAQ